MRRPAWREALAWAVLALLLRAPLVARIEGVLDDDQSVVGLMALDIARGSRLPVFFDGQRYMGAIEAYTAAAFVRVLGHGPVVVALAPLLYHGLFVALTFLVWRAGSDRATARLAALIAAVGSPMLVLWSIAPRGGYSEVLAWGIATIGGYRALADPARPRPGPALQFGWGMLLALGYFINPLSLVIYATLGLDWLIGSRGTDLRQRRPRLAAWLAGPAVTFRWALLTLGAVTVLSVCCHVRYAVGGGVQFVYGAGLLPPAVGITGALAVLAAGAWCLDVPQRLKTLLAASPWGCLGGLVALAPMTGYSLGAVLGWIPKDPSLPVWIQAPWTVGPSLGNLLAIQPGLLGSDPRLAALTLISNPLFRLPQTAAWPLATMLAQAAAPVVAIIAIGLVVLGARVEADSWRTRARLTGSGPGSLGLLATLGITLAVVLYLIEATSAGLATTRYLVIAWVFLPGLLACGLQVCPPLGRYAGLLVLLLPWLAGQVALGADMDRPSPTRVLAGKLREAGVRGVVTQPYLAIVLANLTHGQVGALQYQSTWPRLRDRYRDRFPAGRPVMCVVTPRFPSAPHEDLGRHLENLAARYPGRVARVGEVSGHELWRADLPVAEVLRPAEAPAARLIALGEGGRN